MHSPESFNPNPEQEQQSTEHYVELFRQKLLERAAQHAEQQPNRRVASMSAADVQELEALRHRVRHEELTGLLNRTGFAEMVATHQANGEDGTLIIMDIDDFKKINTDLGHIGGDAALVAVSLELLNKFRIESDEIGFHAKDEEHVGRIGGDEFFIYLPNATPEQIYRKFQDPENPESDSKIEVAYNMAHPNHNNILRLSGGITTLNATEDLQEAIRRADEALMAIKESGQKNRFEIAK